MSAETTVTVSQQIDGRYTAVEPETGATGEGETRAAALADLARALASIESAAQIEAVADSLQETITVQREALEQVVALQSAGIEELKETTEPDELSNAAEFVERTQQVQARFEEEDVDEDDIEDAIRWARSQ